MGVLPRSHTFLPHRVVRKHLGTMSWNPNAFASIVQAQPLLIFGRPVHLRDGSLDYDPVVLRKPFRLHLTMDALPCPITTGPSEALPPLLNIDPGPRVEWDFNPPETCAARHTLRTPPTPGTAQCDFVPLYAPVDVPPTSLHRVSSTAPSIFRNMPSLLPRKTPKTASVLQVPEHRPSPYVHWVGIFISNHEATSGFTSVTACCVANGELTTSCYQNAAPLSYRGARTIPRTGL